MTQNTPPQLPPDLYRHVLETFRTALPRPLSDSPEHLQAAIDKVAAMHPATITEADQAAMFVVLTEHYKDSLRQAEQPGTPLKLAYKCRATALSLMRSSQSALKMLLDLQAARRKLEADPVAHARAQAQKQHIFELLSQALHQQQAPQADPQPKPAPQPAAPHKPASPPRSMLIQDSGTISKVTIH